MTTPSLSPTNWNTEGSSITTDLAYNLHTLQYLKWIMEISLTKTLAAKYQLSVKAVYDKYQTLLTVDGKTYKGLQVTVTREGKKPLVATWGGILSSIGFLASKS